MHHTWLSGAADLCGPGTVITWLAGSGRTSADRLPCVRRWMSVELDRPATELSVILCVLFCVNKKVNCVGLLVRGHVSQTHMCGPRFICWSQFHIYNSHVITSQLKYATPCVGSLVKPEIYRLTMSGCFDSDCWWMTLKHGPALWAVKCWPACHRLLTVVSLTLCKNFYIYCTFFFLCHWNHH